MVSNATMTPLGVRSLPSSSELVELLKGELPNVPAAGWPELGRSAVVAFQTVRERRCLDLVQEATERMLAPEQRPGDPEGVALACLPGLELLVLATEDPEVDEHCRPWWDLGLAAVSEALAPFEQEWRVTQAGDRACGHLAAASSLRAHSSYVAALVHLSRLTAAAPAIERSNQGIETFRLALSGGPLPDGFPDGSDAQSPLAGPMELPPAAYRHGIAFGDAEMRDMADGFLRAVRGGGEPEAQALLWARFAPFRPQIPAVLDRLVAERPGMLPDGWLGASSSATLALAWLLRERARESERIWRVRRPRPAGVRASELDPEVIERNRVVNLSRRSMGPDDLDALFELLDSADEVISVGEAFERRGAGTLPARVIALRYDVDWDLEQSVLHGEMHAARGYRASFYMLHTDWYYRRSPSSPLSSYLLDACARLDSLGHEIGLHNNAIAAAVPSGDRPEEIVRRELDELRGAGFDVVGTVAHGEQLCHTYGFVNSEVFAEYPRPALGDPDRVIAPEDPEAGVPREVRLRPLPLADFGLAYEAGYLGHTLYLTDSSGTWHLPFEEVKEKFIADGGLLQVLVHAAYWALDDEPFTPREPNQTAFPGSVLLKKLAGQTAG